MHRSNIKSPNLGPQHMSFVQRQKLLMKQRELTTMAKGAVAAQ